MTESTPVLKNTLLNGGLSVWQPKNGYRTSIDPIFLAAACHPQKHQTVLDLGCGVGTIGLCLKYFDSTLHIDGVDIQEHLITLAKKNAIENNFENISYYESDIRKTSGQEYDHVVMNPPFYESGSGTPSPHIPRATAHNGKLEDWFDAAAQNLKKGGELTAILPAHRLDDALKLLRKYQLGALHIIPLFSKLDRTAKRIIFQARKHKRAATVLHPGIVVHQQNGDYTDTAAAILYGKNKLAEPRNQKRE